MTLRKKLVEAPDAKVSRRGFIKAGVALLGASLPVSSYATASPNLLPERKLSFYNTHTGESLSATYWADGAYQPDSLAVIYHLLRDFRTEDVKPINSRLLDLLHSLTTSLETDAQLHVISGYRSPRTNSMLSGKSSGVAKHSLHMDGLAIDIRIPGRELADVRKAAIALHSGGVGYYPDSNFVHVDVGRVRTW